MTLHCSFVLKMSGARISYRLGGGRQTCAAHPAAPADEYAYPPVRRCSLALVDYLSTKRYDAHLRRLRRQLAERKQQAWQALLRHLPPEVKIHHSDSGYFLWLELPEGADASALSARALAYAHQYCPRENVLHLRQLDLVFPF